MDFDVSFYTEIGAREHNEDAVSVAHYDKVILVIVADGVGGSCNGKIASDMLVSVLNSELCDKNPCEDILIDAVQLASERISSQKQSSYTTAAVLWLSDYVAIIGNVGDSRIYHFRNEKIIYQSFDHSVAQLAVMAGQITSAEIRNNKDRNKLIRAVGDKKLKVDTDILICNPNDSFLICSDGFWNEVSEEAMLEDLKHTDTAVDWLNLMRQRIGKHNVKLDNNTAVAVRIL